MALTIRRWFEAAIWLLLTLITASVSTAANSPDAGTVRIARNITIHAENRKLGEVLADIREKTGVQILGLEDRLEETITFSASEAPVDKVLKRLLLYLNEVNYAFVYSRTRLRRIAVFPKSNIKSPAVARTATDRRKNPDIKDERVVRVERISEGSQAETLDLQKGDLIVDYDGKRIKSAQDLVDAVKAKSADESVEMTVVRDRQPFSVVLSGGLIGIHIRTVSVTKADLGM